MSASSSTERIKTTGGRRRVKKTIEVPVSPSNGSAIGSNHSSAAASHAPLMPPSQQPAVSASMGFYGPSYNGALNNGKSTSPRGGSKAFPRHSRQKSGGGDNTSEHDGLNDDDDTLDEPSMLETHYRGHASAASSQHHHHQHHHQQQHHRKKDSRVSEIGALDDMDVLSESEVAFLRAAAKKQAQSSAIESSETSVGVALRQNDVVVLDVGGERFTTTLATLTKFRDTFFGALFGGGYTVPRQDDNSVFIDRDGTHFRNILNFLRCGTMVWPAGARARREVLLEASFYGLDKIMLQASTPLPDAERDAEGEWRSNVIFIGTQNIDRTRNDSVGRALADVQAPSTSEMVWQSIYNPGLTVIFQIINDENSDFSLAGISRVLALLERWRRPLLRFVLVYDAELIRELLKLSGEPFNNSSYIWYFSQGKLIDCGIALKLRYVSENIWRHHAFVSSRVVRDH